MDALFLVRILRRLPHTWKFDRHLTNCAALAVIYHPFGGAAPLNWRHVLQLEPLPPFVDRMSEEIFFCDEDIATLH